ncbi:hypothetical protein HY604_05375 [Candidatus Peregrinibacteria bacterium]|nr:hypothetical protein [Candidatus Peregrinibacteria bacterium]
MNGAGREDPKGPVQRVIAEEPDKGQLSTVAAEAAQPDRAPALIAVSEVVAKGLAEASDGCESSGFRGFETVLGSELLALGGAELGYVAKFFDNFAEKMGFTDAPFFKHGPCLEHFRRSFSEFHVYLERQIAQIEELRGRAILFNAFSDNWQNLVQEAAYYAFFVHYGATRSGEEDAAGNPRDYIYHPIRAAFKVMGKRMWYLAEPEFVAEILHDTREDVHKGMLAVLMADDYALDVFALSSNITQLHRFTREAKRTCKPQALDLLDEMEAHFDLEASASREKDLKVSELIALLTKTSSNRSRAFLQMVAEILKYDKSGRLFEAAVALDVCKACDRFDNSVSLSPEGSSGQIKNETAYLFLARAIALQAWNEVDWWHDYLVRVDPAARRWLSDLIRNEAQRREERGRKVQKRSEAKKTDGIDSKDGMALQSEVPVESPATLMDDFRAEFCYELRDFLFRKKICTTFREGLLVEFPNHVFSEMCKDKNIRHERFDYGVRRILNGLFEDANVSGRIFDLLYGAVFFIEFDKLLIDNFYARIISALDVALKDELPDDPRRQEVLDEKDFGLQFRAIGVCYEDFDKIRAKASSRSLEKTFRHYVIFYPMRTNRALCEAAAQVFKALCPDDLDKDHMKRPELTNDLGKRIVAPENRYGVPLIANGKSRKYGVVIWGIFKHQRDAIATFHGDYHLGKFDFGNEGLRAEARQRVEAFYRKVAPEAVHLQKQYALVDRFGAGVAEDAEPNDVRFWTKLGLGAAKVGKFLAEIAGRGDVNEVFLKKLKVGRLQIDEAETMRGFLDKQVLLLFMYKEEREFVVNGRKMSALVPREMTDEQALCFICPVMCLGRKVNKVSEGVFEIEAGPFRKPIFDNQTAFIDVMLDDYKRELISDELTAWRDDSVRRGRR